MNEMPTNSGMDFIISIECDFQSKAITVVRTVEPGSIQCQIRS